MRAYTRKLDGKTYAFRLTIGAQRELREKYHEETIQTVLSAPNDMDKMSDLLGAAAGYPGNVNAVTDGDTIYDLLVDDGVCGPVGFTEVAAQIAVASGIFDKRSHDAVSETIRRDWNSIWDGLVDKKEDPTSAPMFQPGQTEKKPETATAP